MDVGANHAAKLEPFLLMSKSAKGAAAAKLIRDATSAPGVFVFTELLNMPNIQELKHSENYAKWYALLEVFSHKTYRDYQQRKDELPPLDAAQTTKLKHLSIVSIASSHRILPYTRLLSELSMPSIRDLEDLIIDAIYLSLLRGKLDQKEQQLEVEYTMGRDLEPGRLEDVLAALKDWISTTQSVLQMLDTSLSDLASHRASSSLAGETYELAVNMMLKDILERPKEGKASTRRGGMGGTIGFITERTVDIIK